MSMASLSCSISTVVGYGSAACRLGPKLTKELSPGPISLPGGNGKDMANCSCSYSFCLTGTYDTIIGKNRDVAIPWFSWP